jgi:hypothetical protein
LIAKLKDEPEGRARGTSPKDEPEGRARGTSAQIGVLNAAGVSDGFRLGVVNVAEHDDGKSFAILNLIGNGIHDVAVYGTDALLSNVGVELGGRHLFTSFSFSYQPGDATASGPVRLAGGDRRWGYGGGFGWSGPAPT